MKIKTSELTGAALDWAVAKCENTLWLAYENALNNGTHLPVRPSEFLRDNNWSAEFSPSTDWSQGGPIIEREGIGLTDRVYSDTGIVSTSNLWRSMTDRTTIEYGPTPLIAAMRCFCASRLGDEVEIPEELK